jgi:hypothetical protein
MSGRSPTAAVRLLPLMTLLALLGASVHPGRRDVAPPAGPAYLFLSPNTEEDLSAAEAARRLRSPGQAHFRRLAGDILRHLGVVRHHVRDAVGDWPGGVENSLLVEVPDPPADDTLCYAAVWFGLLARQKEVLAFRPGRQGPDAVVQLDLPEHDLAELRRALDQYGITCRTIVPTDLGHRVLVYDAGCRLRLPLVRLARRYGAAVRVTAGDGVCLGELTRGGAEQRYQALIRAYEALLRRPKYRPVDQPPLARHNGR